MVKKIQTLAAWIMAVILLQTLYFKFTGAEESRWIFSQLGAEPVGRLGSGVIELVLAVGLLVPQLRAFAALGAVLVMGGAIGSHLLILGIEVKGDGGLLFGLALVVALLGSWIAFSHRQSLARDVAKLTGRAS